MGKHLTIWLGGCMGDHKNFLTLWELYEHVLLEHYDKEIFQSL